MLRTWKLAVASLLVILSGCGIDEMPAHSPDGRTVMATTEARLWFYDTKTRRPRSLPWPEGWEWRRVFWAGEHVAIAAERPGPPLPGPDGKPFRTPGGETVPSRIGRLSVHHPQDLSLIRVLAREDEWITLMSMPRFALIGFGGEPAIVIEDWEHVELGGDDAYRVLLLPDFLEYGPVPLPEFIGAGACWSVRKRYRYDATANDSWRSDLEIFDERGHHRGTVREQDATRATHQLRFQFPQFARVSRDRRSILLAFESEYAANAIFSSNIPDPPAPHPYTFGVFDIASGRLLWRGASDSLRGTPVVRRDEAWTFEREDAPVAEDASEKDKPVLPPAVVLTRHTPGPDSAKRPVRHGDGVLRYTFEQGDRRATFAPDPAKRNLLMLIDGERPRVVYFPLRKRIRKSDLEVVELREHVDASPAR